MLIWREIERYNTPPTPTGAPFRALVGALAGLPNGGQLLASEQTAYDAIFLGPGFPPAVIAGHLLALRNGLYVSFVPTMGDNVGGGYFIDGLGNLPAELTQLGWPP